MGDDVSCLSLERKTLGFLGGVGASNVLSFGA